MSSYVFSGNTVTVFIMRRKEFAETFHKLLIALAVFDNIFIISALFTLIVRLVFPNIFHSIQSYILEPSAFLTILICGFSPTFSWPWSPLAASPWSPPCTSHLPSGRNISISFYNHIVYNFSIERYFGICYPIQSRVGRRKRVLVYLVPVIVGRLYLK